MQSVRFGWLYEDTVAPDGLINTPVADYLGAKTLPSLGSLVPGWTITFPAVPALNIASLPKDDRANTLTAIEDVSAKLKSFPGDVYHFEHGAAFEGSLTGCGVDLAHLHSVPLSFDLIAEVKRNGLLSVDWESVCLADAWDSSKEYLLIWKSGDNFALRAYPASPTSQYFRRVIAKASGCGDLWDYRRYGFVDNIRATRAAFSDS